MGVGAVSEDPPPGPVCADPSGPAGDSMGASLQGLTSMLDLSLTLMLNLSLTSMLDLSLTLMLDLSVTFLLNLSLSL